LVNPPQFSGYPQPPMGIASIASVLEREGYSLVVVDANALGLEPEAVLSAVADARIVGLTAMTPTINSAIHIAQRLKQARPDLALILGGSHATLLPEETLSSAPGIDVIVRGEGEKIIIEILRAIADKDSLDGIAGISYRKNGDIVSNPSPPGNVDLDSLPFLAYHLLPRQRYRPHPPHGRALPFAAIITSRGCPYHCAYCSKPVFGSKFRAQSPERVVAELSYYQKQFGVREIAFYDDVFTLNKQRAHAIAEGIIRQGLKIDWTCETRVDLIDEELLRHMKDAGCYTIAYGIESASAEILETLHKGISLAKVEEAVRITRKVGMQTIGYFMLGSPGETPQTIRRTIELAKSLKLDFAQFAITTPFPGTELYNIYLKNGHQDVAWEDFAYAGTGGGVTPVFETDRLSKADLRQWASKAYREFYLRPGYITQRLQGIRSPSDLKINLKGFSMLLRNIR